MNYAKDGKINQLLTNQVGYIQKSSIIDLLRNLFAFSIFLSPSSWLNKNIIPLFIRLNSDKMLEHTINQIKQNQQTLKYNQIIYQMQQQNQQITKDKQTTKLEPELYPSQEDQSLSSSCKQHCQISQSTSLLKKFQENFNCRFQNCLENPMGLIFQLLNKLEQAYNKLNTLSKKYTDLQIQMYNLNRGLPASMPEKVKEDMQHCLTYHNIWSSRNDLILINADSKKGCIIDNNRITCSKKNHDKFTNSFGILNKTPDNCSLEIKLQFNQLKSQFKFEKDDYIRLKLFPIKTDSSTIVDPVRCITLDAECIEKKFLSNGDIIKFKIDLFTKKAKAYCNEEMVKFNDDLKMKKLQIIKQKFIPTLEFHIGSKNPIRNFQLYVSLDFIYKDI